MTQPIKLMLLGHPRLEREGVPLVLPRRRAMALLAYLATTRRSHNRDTLTSLLYPDLDASTGRAELRRILSTLKRILSEEMLHIEQDTVVLSSEIWVDVSVFDTTFNADTISTLTTAASLYRDGFMTGFTLTDSAPYDDWQFEQSEVYRLRMLNILRRLTEHHTEQNEFEEAITYARRWLACDALAESAYRALMRLYAKTNQTTLALRLYEECARLMAAELHIQPSVETIALYEVIKNHRAETQRHPMGLMPSLPQLVVGRETVIDDLVSRLESSQKLSRVIVVQGWPGVGKTTTLAALTHDSRIAHLFPDGVLWTSLGAAPNLLTELSMWAHAVGMTPHERTSTIEELTVQIRRVVQHRRMLILVDDVWAVAHTLAFQVNGPQCLLVFSTRQNHIANALAPTSHDIYKLPVLSEVSALDLLNYLAPDVVKTHRAEALALAQDLEYLPLALQVAGRLLRAESQFGWGIGELLTELREGKKLLASEPPADVSFPQASPTITALLQKSTDMLSEEMRSRFIYLGIFAPKPATYDLAVISVAWNETDPRPGVRFLIDRGLLEPAGGERFQMHALLVMHARALADRID
jgi:DNA-binding SARP family transcriptional activator